MSEVRLKSEVPPPLSAGVRWSLGLLILVAIVLMVFGIEQWYFAKVASWWLALPVGLLGVLPAVLLNRAVAHSPDRRLRERSGPWVMLLLLPCFTAAGFSVGAPAIILRILGPDQQITAKVASVGRESSRGCRRQIEIARFANRYDARFCLSQAEFDLLRKQRTVVIATREGYFGTLAFSIRPAELGPE